MSGLQIEGYSRDPHNPNNFIPKQDAARMGAEMVAAATNTDGNFPGERYTVESVDNGTDGLADGAILALSKEELATLASSSPESAEVGDIMKRHGMAFDHEYTVLKPDGHSVVITTDRADLGTEIRRRPSV